MNITLIGASGFVGTRLMDLLLHDERNTYHVKNVDIQHSHFFDSHTTIADVCNQEEMDRELAGSDLIVLLAAQHRDDVSPVSLYYDTNVGGMEKTLQAMEKNNVRRIVFFSSVAVYGLNKENPGEEHFKDPFNHYGKSKWQAEQMLQKWYESHPDWNINIIRPTVIFGERNRGNVYNLLKQIAGGKFLVVGDGRNVKSMAYVGNVTAFVKHMIDHFGEGYNVFNYIDKPDYTMNDLVLLVNDMMGKQTPSIHVPYMVGMMGGYCFDLLAKITGRKLAISSVRVKKFCSTTQFDSSKAHATGFTAPFSLREGLRRTIGFEFLNPAKDEITFKSE